MFRKFHEKRENEKGFTLIELLVVILIIAILAAIAIPVFLRQREKGWIGAMESSLKNAATSAESYATGEGNGGYTDMDEAALEEEGWNPTDEVELEVVEADDTYYCLQATHTRYDGDQSPMFYTSEGGRPIGGAESCEAADTPEEVEAGS